MGYGEKRKR